MQIIIKELDRWSNIGQYQRIQEDFELFLLFYSLEF